MKYVVYVHNVIFALTYLCVWCKNSCSWFDQSQYEPLPDNGSLNIIVWYGALTDGEDWGSLVVGLLGCVALSLAGAETSRAPFIIIDGLVRFCFYFLRWRILDVGMMLFVDGVANHGNGKRATRTK